MGNLKEIARKILNQEVSAVDTIQKSLDSIEKQRDLNSYISVFNKAAIERANKIDQEIKAGISQGLLAGVPIAIKDTIVTKQGRTTCGSKMLEDFKGIYQATVLERLEKEGAIFIGKTNTDEFAMGSSTETSAFGRSLNPLDNSLIPGGSSGGSASAVASKTVLAALGSDTGGSIRQPAACCGIVGVKPTYGRVSRYGLVAFASSLDQIGPMTSSVEDAALMLNIIAGKDPKDQTSSSVSVPDFSENIQEGIKDKTIGYVKECFDESVNPLICEAVQKSLDKLKSVGANLKEVSLPHLKYGVSTYYVIATAEASSNLSRYDGVKFTKRSSDVSDLNDLYTRTRSEFFGEEVQRRILLGSYVLSSGFYEAYYLQAQKMRTQITQDFTKVFESVDFITMPTMPDFPAPINSFEGDPLKAYLQDVFTVGLNLSGLPGISVPINTNKSKLSTSLQLIAPAFQEKELFKLAYTVENL